MLWIPRGVNGDERARGNVCAGKDDEGEAGKGQRGENERRRSGGKLQALQKVLGVDFKSNQVEVAVCSKDRTRFRSLEEKEIDEYLTIISEKD